MVNFIQKCLSGEAFIDEIDDYVDQWHAQNADVPSLREFLGMSKEEYTQWLINPDSLADILADHVDKINKSIFVTTFQPVYAVEL